MERLTSRGRGSTLERTHILHDLGWAALREGLLSEAGRMFEEGLALTRSQRAARPVAAALLVGLSAVERVQGQLPQSLHRARTALECAPNAAVEFSAALSLGTTYRLGGDTILATRYHYLARRDAARFDALEDVQALMTLMLPGEHRPPEALLSAEVVTRLAMHDAETRLQAGESAGFLASLPLPSRYAVMDEVRVLPAVAAALGTCPPSAPPQTVHVQTKRQLGLNVSGRFVPLHGDGFTLALVSYLVQHGPTAWQVVAEATLPEGDEARVYGQVKYHLSRLRGMIGDERAISLRRGRLSLAPHWTWTTDAGQSTPSAAVAAGR